MKVIRILNLLGILFCLGAFTVSHAIKYVRDGARMDGIGYNLCDMKVNGELSVIKTFIAPGAVVFDVGANKGDWSNDVFRHHPNVSIYAFEPIPALYSSLTRQFAQYRFAAYELAISKEDGLKSFDFYEGENSRASGLYERPIIAYLSPSKLTVKTMKLDSFCKEMQINRIDFLKIDTEGSEFDVLCGARELIKNRAIKVIQFEYGGTYKDAGITLKEVYRFLRQHGYEVYRIAPKFLIHIQKWRDALETMHYSNYLAIAK
jgi:FkbM family methyltransferase